MELLDPLVCALPEIANRAELNRVGGAGLRARRLHAVLQPVIAQSALLSRAGRGIDIDDAERTCRYTIAAAVAGIRLNHDGIELGAYNRVGRAYFEAGGLNAMLANVAHQEPTALASVLGELLDKLDVPPVEPVKPARVVIAVAAQCVETAIGCRQLVPFLAGDLARLAADADGGVGIKTHGLSHKSLLTSRISNADLRSLLRFAIC